MTTVDCDQCGQPITIASPEDDPSAPWSCGRCNGQAIALPTMTEETR